MGSFSITHWLILLVVVVVVFGTAKLKNAGKDLGGAVKRSKMKKPRMLAKIVCLAMKIVRQLQVMT